MGASTGTNQTLRLAVSLDHSKVVAAAYTVRTEALAKEGSRAITVHGFAKAETRMVTATGPVSLREASDVILELTEAVETQTGQHFSDVAVCFASCHLSLGGHSTRIRPKAERITDRDLAEVHRLSSEAGAQATCEGSHRYLRTHSPFFLDQQTVTKDPEGLAAQWIARTEWAFSDRRTSLINWIEAFKLCGLRVRRVVPQPLASLYASATDYERKQGIMVVDIGHSLTQIIVCRDHLLRFCKIHNLGGDRITDDLSICLKMPPSEAESVKKNLGAVRASTVNPLTPEIVRARATEMARFVRTVSDKALRPRDYVSGVVLVGGGSKLTGLVQEFRQQVHPLCRTASHFGLLGLPELLDDPSFATLAGCMFVDAGACLESFGIQDDLPTDGRARKTRGWNLFARFF
jgi:cell division protein FtsA